MLCRNFAAALAFATIVVGFELVSPNLQASAKSAKCLLVYQGRTYINGPCEFEFTGGDGSFFFDDKKIRTNCRGYDPNAPCSGANTTVTQKGTFGMLRITSPGSGVIYWNAGLYRKADAREQNVFQDGACWINRNIKLCAW